MKKICPINKYCCLPIAIINKNVHTFVLKEKNTNLEQEQTSNKNKPRTRANLEQEQTSNKFKPRT